MRKLLIYENDIPVIRRWKRIALYLVFVVAVLSSLTVYQDSVIRQQHSIIHQLMVKESGQNGAKPAQSDAIVKYLQNEYTESNLAFFDNKLPADTKIDMNETDPNLLASTICRDGNTGCTISFNKEYATSLRYDDLTMFHEMCHIPTFSENEGHGRRWRACMVGLDTAGAFRYDLIDAN